MTYKYGLWLVAGVSLAAIALYFSSIIGAVENACRSLMSGVGVRNLQDAVGYLTAKAKLHAAVEDPSEPGSNTSLAFAERLWILQQMLARRQPSAAASASLPPDVPRLSSR